MQEKWEKIACAG